MKKKDSIFYQPVLGFDFGTKKIGVATGQLLTNTASPLCILPAKDGIPNWDEITSIINEWNPAALVVGIPYPPEGGDGHITLCAKKFANRLQGRYGLPIYLIDELLTSKTAKYCLESSTTSKKKKINTKLDSISAALILETWFSALQLENQNVEDNL